MTEAAGLGLLAADWSQTAYISRNPDQYYERNPILGDHPSSQSVNLYMGAWMIVHPLVTHILIHTYPDLVPYWQWGFIAIEGACVIGNNQNGIPF
jgi:hypothetical protein